MPTYDYVCKACGHCFEQMQSISADPIDQCPKCNEHKVVRKISGGTGLIFKGSGFYKTDYADKEKKPKKSSEKKKPVAEKK